MDIAFSSAAGLSPAGVLSMGFLHPAGLSESSRQQGRTGFTHPIIFVSRWGRGCQHQRFLCSPPGDGASSRHARCPEDVTHRGVPAVIGITASHWGSPRTRPSWQWEAKGNQTRVVLG